MGSQNTGKIVTNGILFFLIYQKSEPESFDWYQKYKGIRDCLTSRIKPTDKILNIGCGNSSITFPPCLSNFRTF